MRGRQRARRRAAWEEGLQRLGQLQAVAAQQRRGGHLRALGQQNTPPHNKHPRLPSRPRKTTQVSLFFSESPTNPYLRCVDIPRIKALCQAHGAVVCIDSTFATPINQQAIALGADLVLHSATK